ncbi:MAG: hypothetical protein ACE5H1_11520, partial [Thermodesulfobacteriota bacterium]
MGKWVCFSCKQEKGIFATHYDYNDLLIGQCPPRFGHDDRLCKNCYNKIKGSSGKAKKINKYYAVALILIPVGVLFLILGTSFSVELIVFGGLLSFIGLMAYFVSGDPQNKRKKKIAVMATVGAIGVLIVPSLAYHEVYSKFYPEEYATQREERELEKLEERLAQEREE